MTVSMHDPVQNFVVIIMLRLIQLYLLPSPDQKIIKFTVITVTGGQGSSNDSRNFSN